MSNCPIDLPYFCLTRQNADIDASFAARDGQQRIGACIEFIDIHICFCKAGML